MVIIMATVRLFAQLREIAGASSLEVTGSTVGEAVAACQETIGPDFTKLLTHCRIWLDGEPCSQNDPVNESSEIAILPPVSGG